VLALPYLSFVLSAFAIHGKLAPSIGRLAFIPCFTSGTSSDWRKFPKIAKLRRMAACIVSFVDLDGIRHSVEVQADGLYEASVLGLCAFRKHELEPRGLTQLEIEVRSSVTHTLTVTKVREWLQRGVRTPKEAVLKERLRALL
jgi:hypothetical protein